MRIVDLSLPFNNDLKGFRVSPAKHLEKDGWNASNLEFYSHSGTHMDSPFHFGLSEKTIDNIALESCIGKAWVIHIENCCSKYKITVSDLGEIEKSLEEGDSLLFHTGWSQYVNQPKYRDELPRISTELAIWCVNRKVKMLGTEAPSVADVNNLKELSEIHSILLNGGITIVEGLCNLENLSKNYISFYAIPLKIENCDGSPIRAFAIEED